MTHRVLAFADGSSYMSPKPAWYASIVVWPYARMSFNFECIAYNKAVKAGIVFW